MELTLDNRVPAVTAGQVGQTLSGEAKDCSGVARVQVSLDGGASHEPVVLAGARWSYDMAEWPGTSRLGFARLRALDSWGNTTAMSMPVDTTVIPGVTPLSTPRVTDTATPTDTPVATETSEPVDTPTPTPKLGTWRIHLPVLEKEGIGSQA